MDTELPPDECDRNGNAAARSTPVSREDLFAQQLRRDCEFEEMLDGFTLGNMTKRMRDKCVPSFLPAKSPSDVFSSIRTMLLPQDRGPFMTKAQEVLADRKLPVWRRLGMMRVGLRRIIYRATNTHLSSKTTNQQIVDVLAFITKEQTATIASKN